MNKDKINPHFQNLPIDYLYHLGIDTSMDLYSEFGDIKYVIFTLSNAEAKIIVNSFARSIYDIPNENFSYEPIYKMERFHMYKVGVTIVISGGVGIQSLLICINEITKLLIHLKKYDVCYFKIGLAAALGSQSGDVIISNKIINSDFKDIFRSIECGEVYEYPTTLDDKIAKGLLEFSHAQGYTSASIGVNLGAHSFGDMQTIMKNITISSDSSLKENHFLRDAYNLGVRSIDMESISFAGFCAWLEISACVIDISISDLLIKSNSPAIRDSQLKFVSRFAPILIGYIQNNNKNINILKQTLPYVSVEAKISTSKIYQSSRTNDIKYDYLNNLNISLDSNTLDIFRGIKYIFMQGSGLRAKVLAKKFAQATFGIEEKYFIPQNLFKNSFFEGYRVGNALSVSHGMGALSVISLLHDITRLMQACGNKELEYIRLGTSGGINVDPGSIVLTDTAYQYNLSYDYKMIISGETYIIPTHMSKVLNEKIINAQPEDLPFKILRGNTIATDDFYLGQCRFDGAIKPKYDENMRQEYFKQIVAKNIYNFEMESVALASFCFRTRIPAAMIAVTIINRLNGDQVNSSSEQLIEFSDRIHTVAINYLSNQIMSNQI